MKKILLSIIWLTSINAHASNMSNRDLLNACNNYPDSCLSYFVGYLEGISQGEYYKFKHGEQISPGTAKDIFVKYATFNPENGDDEAPISISILLDKHGTFEKTEYFKDYIRSRSKEQKE